MPVRPTQAVLLLTLIGVCGYYIPSIRSWEALDPFLLCGFAMLGALVSGPVALEPGTSLRKAIGLGAALSLIVIAAVIATVNHTVKPPILLLPATSTLLRAGAVALSSAAAFALLARLLDRTAGATMAAIGLRMCMAATAYAWWQLPAEDVLEWFAIAMPLAAGLFGAARVLKKPR